MKQITSQQEILKLHEKLKKSLDRHKSEDIETIVGHMGNSNGITVSYSKELNIWWAFDGIAEGKSGHRYWNAFGIHKPEKGVIQNIVCEINYPTSGINTRVAAAWVKEDKNYMLLHSGKIGGGRKGVGKINFIENYNGVFEEIDIDGFFKEVTIIGNLKDKKLPYQIKNFVYEVARIKDLLTSRNEKPKQEDNALDKINKKFNEEFAGIKEYKTPKRTIIATANHGIVVNALKQKIEDKGFLVANNQQRDLYIYNKSSKIETVFEVKTSLSSQSIYTAVGQLYVNSARLEPLPRLIYVIPEQPNENLSITLKKLNIEILVYYWKNDKPYFKNLNKLI